MKRTVILSLFLVSCGPSHLHNYQCGNIVDSLHISTRQHTPPDDWRDTVSNACEFWDWQQGWDKGTTAFMLSSHQVHYEFVDTIPTCNGPPPDGYVFNGCAHRRGNSFVVQLVANEPNINTVIYHEIGHVVLWLSEYYGDHHAIIRPLGL